MARSGKRAETLFGVLIVSNEKEVLIAVKVPEGYGVSAVEVRKFIPGMPRHGGLLGGWHTQCSSFRRIDAPQEAGPHINFDTVFQWCEKTKSNYNEVCKMVRDACTPTEQPSELKGTELTGHYQTDINYLLKQLSPTHDERREAEKLKEAIRDAIAEIDEGRQFTALDILVRTIRPQPPTSGEQS